EEENENRSHRRRSRHRNARRRGNGDRVRSEIVEGAAAPEAQPFEGYVPFDTYDHAEADHAEADHAEAHHEHDHNDDDHRHEPLHEAGEAVAEHAFAAPDAAVTAVEESAASNAAEPAAAIEINHEAERAAEERTQEDIAHADDGAQAHAGEPTADEDHG